MQAMHASPPSPNCSALQRALVSSPAASPMLCVQRSWSSKLTAPLDLMPPSLTSLGKICCAHQRKTLHKHKQRSCRMQRLHLTDEFTNMLMPGTSTRDTNACVIKKKRLLSIDIRSGTWNPWYSPISNNKNPRSPLDARW